VGFSPPDGISMSASNAQRDITLRQRLTRSPLNTFVEYHTRLTSSLMEFGPAE